MKNYIQPGEVLEVTAGGTVASGDVVLANDIVGVAINGAATGETVSVSVKGVFEIAKLSTDVVTKGANLYWDAGNSRLTLTASTHKLAGYAWNDAGNGVATVYCRLIG